MGEVGLDGGCWGGCKGCVLGECGGVSGYVEIERRFEDGYLAIHYYQYFFVSYWRTYDVEKELTNRSFISRSAGKNRPKSLLDFIREDFCEHSQLGYIPKYSAHVRGCEWGR